MTREEEGRQWRLLHLRTIDATREALKAEASVNAAYVAWAHGHGSGPEVEDVEFAAEAREIATECETRENEFLSAISPGVARGAGYRQFEGIETEVDLR